MRLFYACLHALTNKEEHERQYSDNTTGRLTPWARGRPRRRPRGKPRRRSRRRYQGVHIRQGGRWNCGECDHTEAPPALHTGRKDGKTVLQAVRKIEQAGASKGSIPESGILPLFK